MGLTVRAQDGGHFPGYRHFESVFSTRLRAGMGCLQFGENGFQTGVLAGAWLTVIVRLT